MLQHSFGSKKSQQAGSMPLQDQFSALEQAFTTQASPVPPTTGDLEPERLVRMALQYRWIIVACLLLGLVSGLFYTKIQRPMYQSTSKVEVITSSAKVLRELEVSSEVNDLVVFETARQRILSRDVAERVVENLNLAYDPIFLTEIPKFSLMHIISGSLSKASQSDITATDVEMRRENAIATIRKNLSAKLLRNTSILAITYSHPSPAYARAVADATASAYIGLTVDRKLEVSNRARQILEQQAALAKSKLEEAERALVDYADEQGLTVVGDNSDLIAGNINEINKLLAHAVNERLLAERYNLQLAQNGAASLPQSFESNTVQAAKDKLIDLKAEYQQKLATLKPGFPAMRKLRSQIINVERSLKSEIKAIGAGIRIQLEQALSKEESLRAELRKLEEQKRGYQRKNIGYTILRREADSNQTHYQTLIKKLSEVGVGASLKTATASIVDAADFPQSTASPRLPFNLLGGVMLFSILGGLLIYTKELLSDNFGDPEQLARRLDLPVLGTIPNTASMEDADRDDVSVGTASQEAYRVLHTAIQHVRSSSRIQTLLVTSAEPGEGKSVTAQHLAEDFARLGDKVLLLDANLRHPDIHGAYDVSNTLGFSNMLNNSVDAERLPDCFKDTHLANLTVLPAGHATSNPSDLLASPAMPKLLAFFSKNYDMIVIDSSAVSGFADALLMSRESDATLFVVAGKQTECSAVHSALSGLHMTGGKVIGTVLTKFQNGWLDSDFERKCADKFNSHWQDLREAFPAKTRAAYPRKQARSPLVDSQEEPLGHHKVA